MRLEKMVEIPTGLIKNLALARKALAKEAGIPLDCIYKWAYDNATKSRRSDHVLCPPKMMRPVMFVRLMIVLKPELDTLLWKDPLPVQTAAITAELISEASQPTTADNIRVKNLAFDAQAGLLKNEKDEVARLSIENEGLRRQHDDDQGLLTKLMKENTDLRGDGIKAGESTEGKPVSPTSVSVVLIACECGHELTPAGMKVVDGILRPVFQKCPTCVGLSGTRRVNEIRKERDFLKNRINELEGVVRTASRALNAVSLLVPDGVAVKADEDGDAIPKEVEGNGKAA
jgi:hypothetical protein